jgi:hypothetical protein
MFDDWDFATRFRDVIANIAEATIERTRPSARYARVVTIDRAGRKCTVLFPGEPGAVSIPMGSIQPAQPGQTVRIMGVLGDRYIDDVMGEAVISGGTPVGALVQWPSGVPIPAGYVNADGSYYDPSAYPSLFGVYQFTIGQQGQQFRVPTVSGAIIRAA